jgi:integrase
MSKLHGPAGGRVAREFKRLAAARAEEEDLDDDGERRARGTANSTLNQAKSVFTAAAMQLYKDRGLEVPDVEPFRLEAPLRGAAKKNYCLPDDLLIERTFTELQRLGLGTWSGRLTIAPADQKEMFRAICLAVGAGLRKSEINRATWRWFVERGGRPWLRTGLITKNKDGIDMPILQEWWARLKALRPEGSTEDSTVLVDPKQQVYVNIGQWMAELGWQTQKKLHEFRAYVGCQVAEKHGIETASLFLRHGDIRTTQRYYGRYLKLRVIDVQVGEVAPAAAVG